MSNSTGIHPAGYMVLLKVHARKQVGSILLPEQKVDNDKLASAVGQVIEVGPDAYHDKGDGTPWCKPGDYVLFPRWNGLRIECGEDQYRLINDDEVMAVADDPDAFRV